MAHAASWCELSKVQAEHDHEASSTTAADAGGCV